MHLFAGRHCLRLRRGCFTWRDFARPNVAVAANVPSAPSERRFVIYSCGELACGIAHTTATILRSAISLDVKRALQNALAPLRRLFTVTLATQILHRIVKDHIKANIERHWAAITRLKLLENMYDRNVESRC